MKFFLNGKNFPIRNKFSNSIFLNIFNGFNMNQCEPFNDYYKYVVIWHKSIKSQYLIFGVLTEVKNEKIKKSSLYFTISSCEQKLFTLCSQAQKKSVV